MFQYSAAISRKEVAGDIAEFFVMNANDASVYFSLRTFTANFRQLAYFLHFSFRHKLIIP